jgi:hypothetical protein
LLYVRKTDAVHETTEELVSTLIAECQEDALEDQLSVYRVDGEAEIERVAVLFAALRALPKSFKYVRITLELLEEFGARAEPCNEGQQFEYLDARHHEIRGLRDVKGFARALAAQGVSVSGKNQLQRGVKAERQACSYSSPAEWSRLCKWPSGS